MATRTGSTSSRLDNFNEFARTGKQKRERDAEAAALPQQPPATGLGSTGARFETVDVQGQAIGLPGAQREHSLMKMRTGPKCLNRPLSIPSMQMPYINCDSGSLRTGVTAI